MKSHRFHRPPRRKRGFTLIEVLLVLVILVILASLATVNILSAQHKAQVSAAKTQVMAFDEELKHYQLDLQRFPTTDLQALRTPPADLPDPDKWQGPYIDKNVPLDPWNQQYRYQYPGTHNPDRPDVWTTDPKDGKEIGNWEEVK